MSGPLRYRDSSPLDVVIALAAALVVLGLVVLGALAPKIDVRDRATIEARKWAVEYHYTVTSVSCSDVRDSAGYVSCNVRFAVGRDRRIDCLPGGSCRNPQPEDQR